MLSYQVKELEEENRKLKEEIKDLEERVARETEEKKGKEPLCASCRYYVQHYARTGGQFHPVYDGHCTQGRPKNRKPDENCIYYAKAHDGIKRYV